MRELFPDILFPRNLCCFGGGGSGGGGQAAGTTTTNNTTTNTQLPWASYVPPETYKAYQGIMPQLTSKAGTGLSAPEKATYTAQGLKDVNAAQGGAQKSLAGNLARSGARGGATTEAYSDLARGGVTSKAGMLGNIQGLDVSQRGANYDRLMKAIGLPNAPVVTGTATQGATNYAPKGSDSGGS